MNPLDYEPFSLSQEEEDRLGCLRELALDQWVEEEIERRHEQGVRE